jgi:hypothetical protein
LKFFKIIILHKVKGMRHTYTLSNATSFTSGSGKFLHGKVFGENILKIITSVPERNRFPNSTLRLFLGRVLGETGAPRPQDGAASFADLLGHVGRHRRLLPAQQSKTFPVLEKTYKKAQRPVLE